jgi:hypothetical protein
MREVSGTEQVGLAVMYKLEVSGLTLDQITPLFTKLFWQKFVSWLHRDR